MPKSISILIQMNQSKIEMTSEKETISLLEKFHSDDKDEIYLSLEDSIKKYDHDNLLFLDKAQNKEYDKIKEKLNISYSITAKELQNKYSKEIIDAIKLINKTNIPAELPKLPFGKQLSDMEFLELLNKCISYACYHSNKEKLENIKRRLLSKTKILENIFNRKQILKDLLENCLLTILTTDNEADQDDNFNILSKARNSTITPFIKLSFNYNNKSNILDKRELIDIFCSNVYIQYYYKSLDEFIPDFKNIIKNEDCLKTYINNYFQKYDIYFCQLSYYILSITIHTGNVYLKSDYLEEYYNEEDEDSQVVIREKIILNLGHELMHALMREINPEMGDNFFIKSEKKKKENNNQISFKDKFVSNFHPLDANESGNVFDFNFFNGYYFDDLYKQEALLFMNIKNINTIEEYTNKLNNVIFSEKSKGLTTETVNKFKNLEKERARCRRPGSVMLSDLKSYNFNLQLGNVNKKEK